MRPSCRNIVAGGGCGTQKTLADGAADMIQQEDVGGNTNAKDDQHIAIYFNSPQQREREVLGDKTNGRLLLSAPPANSKAHRPATPWRTCSMLTKREISTMSLLRSNSGSTNRVRGRGGERGNREEDEVGRRAAELSSACRWRLARRSDANVDGVAASARASGAERGWRRGREEERKEKDRTWG